MSVTHPSAARVEALRRRWDGQEARLTAIAADLLAGRDWTVHLGGLPYVEEIPALPGERRGRDLRGADLRRLLVPPVDISEATEDDAALVSAIGFEGLRHSTPLEGATPFPIAPESAADITLALRRGDRFLIARSGGKPAGVVRFGQRTEQRALAAERSYIELSDLAVLPAFRRRGVGEALRRAVEAQARADGYDHVLLTTTLELGLVPWYERAGYGTQVVRQVTCPEGTTYLQVVMLLALRAAAAARRSSARSVPAAEAAALANVPPASAGRRPRIFRNT